MTVKELINVLKKAKDIDIAEVTFVTDEKGEETYELDSLSQFSILPDVTVHLRKVEIPIMQPIKHFRRDKKAMISKLEKKIKKDRKIK